MTLARMHAMIAIVGEEMPEHLLQTNFCEHTEADACMTQLVVTIQLRKHFQEGSKLRLHMLPLWSGSHCKILS
jgi:hypothetical protein